jgi:hypothetical protein
VISFRAAAGSGWKSKYSCSGGVSTSPGQIVLTLMFSGPSDVASDRHPLTQPLRYAQGVHPGRLVRTLVEVDTDEGITGLGEIGGSGASSDALIAALRARVVGHDPFQPERLR